MEWNKLVSSNEKFLTHGTVLKVLGSYPYEEFVDFMVFDPSIKDKGLGLIVSSGYKAGLVLVILPHESGEHSLSREWLIKNWQHWVYPECDVSDVYIRDYYESTSI